MWTLLCSLAMASQIAYRDVPLEQVTSQAALVVVGQFLGESKGQWKLRPIRALKGTLPKKPFVAWSAEAVAWRTAEMHHRKDGTRISPIVPQYVPGLAISPKKGRRYLFFLSPDGDDYAFVAGGAMETLDREKAVLDSMRP